MTEWQEECACCAYGMSLLLVLGSEAAWQSRLRAEVLGFECPTAEDFTGGAPRERAVEGGRWYSLEGW